MLAQLEVRKQAFVEHKPTSLRCGPPSHTHHAPPPALSRGRRAISSRRSPARPPWVSPWIGSGFDMACAGSRARRLVRERWITVAAQSLHQGLPVPVPPVYSVGTGATAYGRFGWRRRQSSWCTHHHACDTKPLRSGFGRPPGDRGSPNRDVRGISGGIRLSIDAVPPSGTKHACPHTPFVFLT